MNEDLTMRDKELTINGAENGIQFPKGLGAELVSPQLGVLAPAFIPV